MWVSERGSFESSGVSWELSREVTDLQEPSVKDTNVKLRKNTPRNYVKHLRYVMFSEFPQLVNKKYFFCTFSRMSIYWMLSKAALFPIQSRIYRLEEKVLAHLKRTSSTQVK